MHTHNHQHCIDTALLQAEEICARNSVRLTRLRRHVLQLVWQSHRPVKAYDLLDAIGASGSATPPTVYRALDFLQENRLVHKINSLNAYIGCQHPGEEHDCTFLICTQCRNVAEACAQSLRKELEKTASAQQFLISKSYVEIFGQCFRCGASEATTSEAAPQQQRQ